MTNTIHAEIFGHGFGWISDNTWGIYGYVFGARISAKRFLALALKLHS